jgi:diaminopimelate epimerase
MERDITFLKYQGCGNDFILKDELDGRTTPDAERSLLAKKLWDRHFWVGSDGILFVEGADGVDGSMRLFEPAGNEADMCGNGLRCVAAFLMKKLGKDEVDVLTRDGVKHIVRRGEEFTVDMGPVRTRRQDLAKYVTDAGAPDDSMLRFPVTIAGAPTMASILNTGEPHIVAVTGDLEGADMEAIGTEVNADRRRFPEYVNINLMKVQGPHEIAVRTYERGVFKETLACGTGTTACASAAVMLGLVAPGPVTVHARGGDLTIELHPDDRASMTGPAVEVYEGRVRIKV